MMNWWRALSDTVQGSDADSRVTAPPARIVPHSMRLFPKYQGPDKYRITGIAERCDWVLLSDGRSNKTHLYINDPAVTPRHIFLSLRNPNVALQQFKHKVLPRLTAPFVLISGSEDATVPVQMDHRFAPYRAAEHEAIQAILDHPLLLHWFAENLADDTDPRVSPMPTGMVYPDGPPAGGLVVPSPPLLADRPLTAFCAHRVRGGPQWDLRRKVTSLVQSKWSGWCSSPDTELSEAGFFARVEAHSFVLCVEGGGIDPSPKAWQSILHGAIPIIRETGTRKAYSELPVAFVRDWDADCLDPDRLDALRTQLAPYYDTPGLRAQTLSRLGIDFWWNKVVNAADPLA